MMKLAFVLSLLVGCANLERDVTVLNQEPDGGVNLPYDPPPADHVPTPPEQMPDAPLPPHDCEPPAPPELDEETKAACCHALLDGTPPRHECGYPPGLCNNGKKTLFCKNDAGEDAQFELCNP